MTILKGWFGEKKTAFKLWFFLSKKNYTVYNNLIIPSDNGTTQIDHLVVSSKGLFIIETKNKDGWIFGSENQKQWTQTFYNKKYRFQNPLHQTYRQKKVLSSFLGVEQAKIHSVVYFIGDAKFKTKLPKNVLRRRLIRYIKKKKDPLLLPQVIDEINVQLIEFKFSSKLRRKDHVRSLKERHTSKTTCPKCGSDLVERIAKRGAFKGQSFLGCSNYPRCKFTSAY
jgi:hypothetical protein